MGWEIHRGKRNYTFYLGAKGIKKKVKERKLKPCAYRLLLGEERIRPE